MEQKTDFIRKKRIQNTSGKTFFTEKGYFTEHGIFVDNYQNFFIRLEMLLAKATCKARYIVKGVSWFWHDFFPEIAGSEELYEYIKVYTNVMRRSLFDVAKNVDISDEEYKYSMQMQRILLRYQFLLGVENGEITQENACDYLYDKYFEIVENRRWVNDTIELCIEEYFEGNKEWYLEEHTLSLMETEKIYLEQIAERIEIDLRTRASKISQQNIFNSKFNIVKIEDILETAFLEQMDHPDVDTEKKRLEELIQKHWAVSFAEKEYTNTVEKHILKTIYEDEFLNSLKVLNAAGTIHNIYKASYARFLAYGYTLKYVLTKIGNCRDMDTIIEETLDAAADINFVSVSEEEESDIVEKLVDRYSDDNGEMDEDIVRHLIAKKEMIERMYLLIKDSFNNRYSSKTVEEKEKIIKELQMRMESEDMNTLRKLTGYLTDSNRGTILNRLYRFSKGYDKFTAEMMRDNLAGLFYILEQLGIVPAYEEEIGKEFTETDELFYLCKFEGESATGEYRVHYPGWKLNGSLIVSPVSVSKKDE